MAATLLLDTITSSGSTITVPTGKTIAITDAGALTIGGTAITTGAQGVISKTATYTILAADFTGKSSLIVFVNAAAGTDTETVITLPAASAFGTCAIHVVSSTAQGSGNKITIKNSSAAEQYTLYRKGDHCEFVSDATNVFRTGNEYATVCGDVALTVALAIASGTLSDIWDLAAANYTEVEDIGGGWSTSTDDFTAPFAGEFMFGGNAMGTGYACAFGFKKNGTFINDPQGTAWYYGTSTVGLKPFVVAKDDVITWWIKAAAGNVASLFGHADVSGARATGDWWCHRRY